MKTITCYTDYKSPYAYLAKDLTYELERDFKIEIGWLPYVLDIPSYLGSARLNERGEVIEQSRNAHQWRRVRYSYMDCRRQAAKRGLIIRGTQKIWDSSLAAIGMLWAKRHDASVVRAYHDYVFEHFWKRELDIENPTLIADVLAKGGASTNGLNEFLDDEGRGELVKIQAAAEDAGVFGVPSFLVDGELFWGREHLEDIRAKLSGLER
ncbi:MAG TPA: DsbA family protein [Candidatus Binataceae bacterium]|nr:DsbA family protein [Candidatus Binataceae bacterium]